MEHNKNFSLENIVYFCEFDKIWKTEVFKDIPEYEGLYQVSDLGRVKSLSRLIVKRHYSNICKEKILKSGKNPRGYLIVVLRKNLKSKTVQVHQLVAIAFLNHKPCGLTLVINHKNFITVDNKLKNLEIVTNRENSNKKHIKSSSQYVGVCWNKRVGKWVSCIRRDGKKKFLGSFVDEYEAHLAYQKELKEIHTLEDLVKFNLQII